MKPLFVTWLLGGLLATTLALPARAGAQPVADNPELARALDAQRDIIQNKITRTRAQVSTWERDWELLAFLTALVAVLGVVSSGLQTLKSPGAKVTTFIFGISIGVITAVTAVVYPEDYRSLRLKSVQATAPLDEIEFRLVKYGGLTDLNQRSELLEQLLQKFAIIDEMQQAPLRTSTALTFLPVLYAQSGAPSWVAKPPADAVNQYFVGTARAASLKDASEASRLDAIAKAVTFLAAAIKSDDTAALRQYVERYAQVADVSFVAPQAQQQQAPTYQHFTLLKMNRSYAEVPFVQAFVIAEKPRLSARTVTHWNAAAQATTTERFHLRALKPADGDFLLTFSLTGAPNNRVRLKLDEIQTYQDGSRGSVRWLFDVYVDGNLAFRLPEKHYDDSAKPPTTKLKPEDGAEATVAVPQTGNLEIRVVGYRPKDL